MPLALFCPLPAARLNCEQMLAYFTNEAFRTLLFTSGNLVIGTSIRAYCSLPKSIWA